MASGAALGASSGLVKFYTSGGNPATFMKVGTGTLTLDNRAGGIDAHGTTFQISQGTLQAFGLQPLGAPEEVVLAGGRLTLEGPASVTYGALKERLFDDITGDETLDPIDSSSGFLVRRDFLYEGMLTGGLAFNGDHWHNAPGNFGGMGRSGWDGIGGLWFGTMRVGAPGSGAPLEAGTITLATNSDDGSVWWVDLNQNHLFEPGELIVNNKGWHGTQWRSGVITLAEGDYDIALGFYEGGGGEWMEARWAQGIHSGNPAEMNLLNPGAQSQLWLFKEYGPLHLPNTNITVTADSELHLFSDFDARLGHLTLQNGTSLSLLGAPTSFQSAAVSGGSGRWGALSVSNQVDLGTYNDEGIPTTLIKRGSGRMVVDNTTGNMEASATTWRVEADLFHPLGDVPLGGNSTITLAGGQVQLDGPVTYIPGLLAGSHSGNMWTSGPNPGNLGIVLGPQGLRYETELRDAHWRAERADGGTGPDNTTLIYTGEIYLSGPTTFVEQNDDVTLLIIGGQQVLYDGSWNNAVSGVYIPSGPGWYSFEVRFSNGGGGYGFFRQQDTGQGDSNWDQVSFGFGMAQGVVLGENALNYTYPQDPGNASLFRVVQYGAIQQPNLHIGVDGGGTLQLNTSSSAVLGTLTFKEGKLVLTGAPNGVQFTGGGGVDSGATSFTLEHSMPVTIAGPYDGRHASATFTKVGSGTLTFSQGTQNHEGVSLEVKEGQVVTEGPIQVANLKISPPANVHTGLHNLSLNANGRFQAGNLKITTSTAPMELGGDNLLSGPQRMVLQGGTVAIRNAAEMPQGLVLWLDAGAISGVGNGQPITNWPDRSGQDHHLDNSFGSPLYIAAGLNGLPVVQFNASDGTDALWSSFNFDAYPAYTVLALQRSTGRSDGRITTSRTRNWFFGHHGGGEPRWYAEGWIIQEGNANTEWHLYAGTITADADPVANFWADGTQRVFNNTGSGNGNHTIGQLQLGAWGGGLSEPSNAEVAEILIFGRVLDSQELANVSGYLNTKYGLGLPGYPGGFQVYPIMMPTTHLTVSASTTLLADTPSTATFGNLYVQTGATLTLSGAPDGFSFQDLTGGGSVEGSLSLRRNLAPGDEGVGTLSIQGDLTLDDSAGANVYHWELGPNGHDLVGISGILALDHWILHLLDAGGEAHAQEKLYLFIGPNINPQDPNLPGNWSIDPDIPLRWLEFTNLDELRIGIDEIGIYLIGLQTVPEPSSWILAIAGCLGMLLLTHRLRKGK